MSKGRLEYGDLLSLCGGVSRPFALLISQEDYDSFCFDLPEKEKFSDIGLLEAGIPNRMCGIAFLIPSRDMKPGQFRKLQTREACMARVRA